MGWHGVARLYPRLPRLQDRSARKVSLAGNTMDSKEYTMIEVPH